MDFRGCDIKMLDLVGCYDYPRLVLETGTFPGAPPGRKGASPCTSKKQRSSATGPHASESHFDTANPSEEAQRTYKACFRQHASLQFPSRTDGGRLFVGSAQLTAPRNSTSWDGTVMYFDTYLGHPRWRVSSGRQFFRHDASHRSLRNGK